MDLCLSDPPKEQKNIALTYVLFAKECVSALPGIKYRTYLNLRKLITSQVNVLVCDTKEAYIYTERGER